MKKYPFLISLATVAGVSFILSPCVTLAQTVYFSGNDIIRSITPPGPATTFATLPPYTNPQGLAFDTSGNLFVVGGGNVRKITPGGAVSLFATLPPGYFGGYGMAIDAANNLYVAGALSDQIVKITPGGAVSIFATNTTSATGLAIDSAGNL